MQSNFAVNYSLTLNGNKDYCVCFHFLRRGEYHWKSGDDVYLHDTGNKETKQYEEMIVEVINAITPCSIEVNSSGKRLIKYKTTDSYNKDIVLLSFIRSLWHDPMPNGNYSKREDFFSSKTENYSINFFKFLQEELANPSSPDPMVILTTASKKALELCGAKVIINHSPVVNAQKAAIRTIDDYNMIGNDQEAHTYGKEQVTQKFLTGQNVQA